MACRSGADSVRYASSAFSSLMRLDLPSMKPADGVSCGKDTMRHVSSACGSLMGRLISNAYSLGFARVSGKATRIMQAQHAIARGLAASVITQCI